MNKNKFGKVVLECWRKLQGKCKRWYYGRVNQLWETFCHIRSYQILLAIAYLRKGKGICQFDKKICMIGWLRKIIRINKLQNSRIFSWRDSPFSLLLEEQEPGNEVCRRVSNPNFYSSLYISPKPRIRPKTFIFPYSAFAKLNTLIFLFKLFYLVFLSLNSIF